MKKSQITVVSCNMLAVVFPETESRGTFDPDVSVKVQVRGIIVETGGTLLGTPGHETPKGQGGVPRWNGPRTVRTLSQTPPEPDRKASGWETVGRRKFNSSPSPEALHAAITSSPPCSRRHALVILPACFIAGQVARQAGPISASAILSGAYSVSFVSLRYDKRDRRRRWTV